MGESAIKKINKLGLISGRLTKIMRVLGTIAIIILILAGICTLINPEIFIEAWDVKFNGKTFTLPEVDGFDITENMIFTTGSFIIHMIAMIVQLIVATVTVYHFEQLCYAFSKCESPFEENVIQKIKCFSIFFLAFFIFSIIRGVVSTTVLTGSIAHSLDFSFWDIAMVVIIELLLYIFKYGAVLQRESDETL